MGGYKSAQSAQKALWYKFKNGKEIISEKKFKIKEIAKNHKDLVKFVGDLYLTWFKELARGEITDLNFIKDIDEKFGIKLSVSQIRMLGDC